MQKKLFWLDYNCLEDERVGGDGARVKSHSNKWRRVWVQVRHSLRGKPICRQGAAIREQQDNILRSCVSTRSIPRHIQTSPRSPLHHQSQAGLHNVIWLRHTSSAHTATRREDEGFLKECDEKEREGPFAII